MQEYNFLSSSSNHFTIHTRRILCLSVISSRWSTTFLCRSSWCRQKGTIRILQLFADVDNFTLHRYVLVKVIVVIHQWYLINVCSKVMVSKSYGMGYSLPSYLSVHTRVSYYIRRSQSMILGRFDSDKYEQDERLNVTTNI